MAAGKGGRGMGILKAIYMYITAQIYRYIKKKKKKKKDWKPSVKIDFEQLNDMKYAITHISGAYFL